MHLNIGSYGYIGGGQISSTNYSNDFWEYNEEGIWTQKANFGGGERYAACSFTINGIAYVLTGYNVICKNDVWTYNPQTNTWIQKNNFPGLARYGAFAFSIGDKGYLGMGSQGTPPFLNDFWEYNSITDTWIQKNSFSTTGRYGVSAFSTNYLGYAGLGSSNGNGTYFNDFYEFDPISGNWTQKSQFPGTPRYNSVSFSIFNIGYLGTGQSGTNYTYEKDFWQYNTTTDTWSVLPNVSNINRSAAVGFAINGKGYIALGYSNTYQFLNDLWEFTPATFSINESNSLKDIEVKFNNNSNQLILSSSINTKVNVQIYSAIGNKLLDFTTYCNSINQIKNLRKGTYFYYVRNNSTSKIGKFIVL